MPSDLVHSLSERLLAAGDDEFLLGHRNSEWCGRAPILEEDIALANLALDEIGHATLWYGILSELLAEDPATYPDRLVFEREAGKYRNIQMVELPNGDFAWTMLRQYLFDAAETVRLPMLAESSFPAIAGAAKKILKEELYHERHSRAWVLRLGQGTEESRRRMQAALDDLWPYTRQMFTPWPEEQRLATSGIWPDESKIAEAWNDRVIPLLSESGLKIPEAVFIEDDRRKHTPHLQILLREMQSVASMDPGASW